MVIGPFPGEKHNARRPEFRAPGNCGLFFAGLQLFALFAQNSFAAELDLIAFKAQHLHQDLIAFLQLIANFLDRGSRRFR